MQTLLRKQAIKLYDLSMGRAFYKRLEELNRTQWLSRDEILAIQQKKLHALLTYAYQYVPYYRRVFDEVEFKPDDILTDLNAFHIIPTISKSIINQNFADLTTTDPTRQKDMSPNHTSGSTGQRLNFLQDNCYRDYVTADVHRHIGWTGWRFGESHAYLWGSSDESISQKALRTRLMDWVLNRFVTNAYALSEASLAAFVEEIQQKRPKVIFGYVSALTQFAEYVQCNNLRDIKFLGIISSAEVLRAEQRQLIETTFGCRVLDRYGTREVGGIGCECPEQPGLLHISAENAWVEVLDEAGQPAPVGEEGKVVITNFNNYAMPFIRYHTEDLGRLSDTVCCCGRGLPMMRVVSGRANDMLKTTDGRTIHASALSQMFYSVEGIKQFQIIQKDYEYIVVSLVEEDKLGAEALSFIENRVKELIGSNTRVEINLLESIPLKLSGKHRYIISELQ